MKIHLSLLVSTVSCLAFLFPLHESTPTTRVESQSCISPKDSLITPEFLWQNLHQVSIACVNNSTHQVVYTVKKTDLARDSSYTTFYLMDSEGIQQGTAIDLPSKATELCFLTDGQGLFFLKGDSLWIYSFENKRCLRISPFPISDYRLSGDGQTLFYTRKVKYGKTTQDIYPDMGKSSGQIINSLDYRHLKDWRDEFHQNLFVTDFHLGRPLLAGKNITPEAYNVFNFQCTSDGGAVVYECKKVAPNDQTLTTNTDIYLYNVKTGQTRNLSTSNKGYDQNPVVSPDGLHIAWTSMATEGYETDRNRLMLYELATGKHQELTIGFDANANNPAWADNNLLIFASEKRGTTQLFSANLDGQIQQLTNGMHTVARFCVGTNKIFYTQSSFDKPSEIYQTDLTTKSAVQRTFINTEAMKMIKLGRFEECFCTTFDKKTLQSWVIYPPGFDPKKKYPVILYCQGGPQSPLNSAWGTRWSMQLMAAKGYIVIAPNRRGVFGFTSKWTEEVSQHWGDAPIKDLLAAVDDLSLEPWADENRMAAVGGSFGGYSVYYLAGHHQGRFKAFIAHAGLFNLESFYLTTDEMFFANHDMGGAFWNNPFNPTFSKYNPINFVDKWDTPIMIIHGAMDYRVSISEGIQAFQAAQLKGIPSKFLYFPDEGHWIERPQNSVVWHREFLGWLNLYLQ